MPNPDPAASLLDQLDVSPTLRRVLARAGGEFERSGEWVTFDDLAYEAAERDQPSPLNELMMLPRALGGAWSGETVMLTGVGLLASGTAPNTSHLLASLAGICARRKLQLRDEATISRLLLVTEYGFSEDEAARSYDLVHLLPGVAGGGQGGNDWSLMIHRGALDYRTVHDVPTLTAVLVAKAQEQLRLTAQRTASAAALWTTEQSPSPEDSHPWRAGDVRLFLSHLASYKRLASDVSAELAALRIHGFVAHEDIEVSNEWQAQIETALATMDAFVGLMHPGFSASFWTQQEIGWALGRRTPVLMVRLGEDPKGFPSRWQATTPGESASKVASSIALWLAQQDRVGTVVMDNLVADLANAGSYLDAKQAALRFEEIDRLPAAVLDRLAAAYYSNDQLYPRHVGAVVLERIFVKHHRGWPPPRPD